jgi:ribosome assembly protein YihI (activator of Der GTPase)
VDSKITPEARQRLIETPSAQELRAMRELELLILQKKMNKLREALDADQSDIDTAFAADRLPCPKGWDRHE